MRDAGLHDGRLRSIAEGLSAATGETFFRLLVQQICLVLKADFACVGELQDKKPKTIQTIAMSDGTQFWEGIEYRLAGTPCKEAVMLGSSSYPDGVQAAFPKDHFLVEMEIESYLGVGLKGPNGEPTGVMSVMSRSPLENVSSAESILSIFASRASAELERRKWERALHESELRNRAILTALPDMILVVDRQGVIQDFYANDRGQTNVPAKSILGNNLARVLTPDVAGRILHCSSSPEPENPTVVEYSLNVAGQPRFFEARAVRFGDDRVLSIVRDITSKTRAESDLKESQLFAQRIAETTPNVLFVYDLIERRSVYANERSVDVIGYTPKEIEEMGDQFISLLMHPDDFAALPSLATEYATRGDGEVFEHMFRLKHKNGQWRWLHRTATIFSRTHAGKPKQILGAITDITRFKDAERDLHDLSARLLSAQDEERRRIARELHDTTGQNLTLMGLHLDTIEISESKPDEIRKLIGECRKICRETQKDIRTLSYLLHPPELDLLGLVGALRSYVGGVEKRTGTHIRLDVGKDIERLPSELEIDLFRVVQEALTNIVRHSGSKVAFVRLKRNETRVTLEVEDRGRGLPREVRPENQSGPGLGVGIPGMRERLRHHGGLLEIRSAEHGTLVRVTVPIRRVGNPAD